MSSYGWMALVIAAVFSGYADLRPSYAEVRDSQKMQSQFRRSYLHVQGTHLVAANGQEVDLHGVNVGGWLVTEAWMCGFTDAKDTLDANGANGAVGRSTLESLEQRFGAEDAARLMDAWQDHWITARDLDSIRDSGFNLIRVPIGYRNLQRPDGSWIVDSRGQIDFGRMDWIVREAAQRGIYTIFDLHVWPEQRRAYDKIGQPDGAAIRQSMARLWTAIAVHYRGNGAIAAFDLINEFPGAWGVQQVLSRAVADGDPQRVQVIEGFTLAEYIKLHEAGQFPNSVFSDHLYASAPDAARPLATEEIGARLKDMSNRPAPVYIGEFLAADFAGAAQILTLSDTAWSSWTYKTVDMGDWGVFNYPRALTTDIQNDSYASILAKWSTGLVEWQSSPDAASALINPGRRLTAAAPPAGPLL